MRTLGVVGVFGVVSLLASGCAPAIWDARQVKCGAETDEIRVSNQGVRPLWLYNTDDVDEDCEVKSYGIQFATIFRDGDAISVTGADEVDFEIDPEVFSNDGADYPRLDVQWEEAISEYDDDQGTFNRIDLSYGPSLPLLVLESDGPGRMGYGQDSAGLDSSSEPEDDEVRVVCDDCYVNARVASTFRIRLEGQTEDRECRQSELSGDIGLCTTIQLNNQAPIPASVVCVEPDIPNSAEIVIDGEGSNVKVVVLPGAEPARVRIVADGTVAFYSPDLGWTGSVVEGTLGTLPLSPPGGVGPVLEIEGASQARIFERSGLEELESQCQIARREVVAEDGDDDEEDE